MIIFLALCMTVLLGFTGLATDTGLLWVTRARLQNSVDAGVLAAAQELPNPSTAKEVACTFATGHNAVPDMTSNPEPGYVDTDGCFGADITVTDTTLQVTAYRTVSPIFGQVIGFDPVDVSAQAKAVIGSLGSACVFPLFLTASHVTGSSTFFALTKFSNADAGSIGGVVNPGGGGGGAEEVTNTMVTHDCSAAERTQVLPEGSPTSECIYRCIVERKPGDFNQFIDGWAMLEACATSPGAGCPTETSECQGPDLVTHLQDTDGDSVPDALDPAVNMETCPRLVIIQIAEDGDYSGGSASGPIVGYIPFYFSGYCANNECPDHPELGEVDKGDFWGYYVKLNLASPIYTEYTPDFGTKVVSLAG